MFFLILIFLIIMPCSIALSNAIVMNKYVWMSRQLRNFNDIGSLVNWANAMTYVKNLLLEPSPSAPFRNPQPSPLFGYNQRPHMENIRQSPKPDISISKPTTINFLANTIPLTQSPASCSNYEPRTPSPLTTYTLRLPTVCPNESFPQCPKRRKIAIPPSVEYNPPRAPEHSTSISTSTAQPNPAVGSTNTQTNNTSTATSIAPGTHIWHGFFLQQNNITPYWAFHKFKGSEEYRILQEVLDSKDSFTVKKLTTGEEFTVLLPDISRLRS